MVSRILWGAVGGLCGTLAGHLGVLLAHRCTGDADIWFQGPHGPPFFDLALNTSLYYACLGAALGVAGGGWRRGFGTGFVSSFLIFVIPMALSTHLFAWGEDPTKGDTKAWIYLILGAYIAANAAAVLILGRYCRIPSSWRRCAGAGLGALTALAAQGVFLYLFPIMSPRTIIIGYVAPWPNLILGLFWGLLIAFGAAAADRKA